MRDIISIAGFCFLLGSSTNSMTCNAGQNKSYETDSNSYVTEQHVELQGVNQLNEIDSADNNKQKILTPEMFGATGDGSTHKISEKYKTLAEARNNYPGVKDLSITIDGAAFQKAIDIAAKEGGTVVAEKKYLINYPLVTKNNVVIDGKDKGTVINDRSRPKEIFDIAFFVGNYNASAFYSNGYDIFNVAGSIKAGQNFIELSNNADQSSFVVGKLAMVISAEKRRPNEKNTLLPNNVNVCKVVKIENGKVYFEYPFDENIQSAQVAINGKFDNTAELDYYIVEGVTIKNLTIDASHITLRTNGYKCLLENLKINNAIRVIGLNALSHSEINNISGTFAWRCIEIKTGSNQLTVRNVNATYKPINGYDKCVDAISLGEYNKNITIEGFKIDFNSATPELSLINLRSRKATIKNGTITCKNQRTSFLKFYNEAHMKDPELGCYKNVVSNVKFYGGANMKSVLDIGDDNEKKGQNKKGNVSNLKAKKTKANKASDDDFYDSGDETIAASGTPPSNNIVEDCFFDGGNVASSANLENGQNNVVRNCTFTKAKIKVSPAFKSKNTISNNKAVE